MADKPTILVIDDSNTNVVLLDVVLEKEGYEVVTALSAKEAMKYMEKAIPDLILLDILMPQTNGFEFLENIRKEDRYSKVPVIMVSAVATEENRKLANHLGAVDFFEKPLDVGQAVNKIKSVLS